MSGREGRFQGPYGEFINPDKSIEGEKGILIVEIFDQRYLSINPPEEQVQELYLPYNRLREILANADMIASDVTISGNKVLSAVDQESIFNDVVAGKVALHSYKTRTINLGSIMASEQDVAFLKVSNRTLDDPSMWLRNPNINLTAEYLASLFVNYLQGQLVIGVGSWFVEDSARDKLFSFALDKPRKRNRGLSTIMADNIVRYTRNIFSHEPNPTYIMSLRLDSNKGYKHPLRETLLQRIPNTVEVMYLPIQDNGSRGVCCLNDDPAWKFDSQVQFGGAKLVNTDYGFNEKWLGMDEATKSLVGAIVFTLVVSIEKAGVGAHRKYRIYRDFNGVAPGSGDAPKDISFIVSRGLVDSIIEGLSDDLLYDQFKQRGGELSIDEILRLLD